MNDKTFSKAIKIGLSSALAILAMQCLRLLVMYDFLTFDTYTAVIAIVFLLAGYFLVQRKGREDYSRENPIERLTGREFSVLKLVAEGKTNKEIAAIMMVEVSTIKTHTNNLYGKIGCKNRNDARNLWMKINHA